MENPIVKSRRAGKLFVVGAGLCAVLVLVTAALSIGLNSTAFHNWVLGQVNRSIVGHFTLDSLNLSLFRGRLKFSNVVLNDSGGTPLVTIGHGELAISWSALLCKEIKVARCQLVQPTVHLLFDHQDQLTILGFFPDSDSDPSSESRHLPANIVIDDLLITEGSLILKHPNREFDLVLEGIDLKASGNLALQRGRMHLTVASLRQQTSAADQIFKHINLDAQYNGSSEAPLTLILQLAESQISASGDPRQANGATNLKAEGDFDLALNQIAGLLPDVPALKGRATGHFSVTGVLDDPEITLAAEVHNAAALDIEAEHLTFNLNLKERQIAIKQLLGKGKWGQMEASGQVDLRPLYPQNFNQKSGTMAELGHNLAISLQGLQLWQLPMVPLPWLGEWQGSLHLIGNGVPLVDGDGRLESRLAVKGFRLPIGAKAVDGTLTIDTGWKNELLTVDRCRLEIDNATTVEANGVVDLEHELLIARAHLRSTSVASLGPFLDLPLPDGRASMDVEAHGALSGPELKAVLQAEALQMEEIVLGDLTARMLLDKELRWRLGQCELTNQSSRLSAAGEIALDRDDPTVQFDLRFTHLDPAHFAVLPGFSGRLDGRLTIGGSLDYPVAELHLEHGQLSFKGFTSDIEAAAAWRQEQLTLARLSLFRGRSSLVLRGKASWQNAPAKDPHMQLNLLGEKLQLADFDEHLKGLISLTSDLSGPLSRLEGHCDLRGDDLEFGGQKVKTLRCRGRLEEHVVVLEQLAAGWGPHQMVTGHGRYEYDGSMALELSTHGLALSHFDLLRQREIDGKLDLTLQATGPPSRPMAAAKLAISRPRLEELSLDDIQLQAQLQNGRLEAHGQMVFPLKATLELDRGDFTAEADMTHTDLSPYLRLAGLEGWHGRLSGRAALDGNLDQWEQARIKVDLRDLLLAQAKNEVVKTERLAVTFKNGIVDLPATHLRLMRRGNLTVAAHGPPATDLSITAEGQIPAAVLETFADTVAPATGQVVVKAGATGPIRNLEWNADLALENIGLGLPGVAQRIENLNGKLTLTPHLVTVSGISAAIDDGHLTAAGSLGLSDLTPDAGRLDLKLQNAPFEIPGTLDLIIDSDLTLRGANNRAVLEGKVTLLEGSYYKNVRLDLLGELARLTKPQRSLAAAPAPTSPPAWLQRIDLNVAVTARNPLIVDNNMAAFDIVPDLKVGGTAARPLATGRAAINEGQIVFRGYKFNIDRGIVDFLNPYKFEPSFDIEASATIRQWEVTLAVSGPPDQLAVKLSSDPAESENDILSLILLGQTTAELSSGQSGATTEQMLASLIATAWGEDLKKSAHVDILEVQTGAESATDSADRIQVTVGKKINSRMTLKYEVESNNGEMIQRAVSEYRLLEHLLASGFQDNHGRYGGELLFRLEFR